MDQELSWAFEFFEREAREYQDIKWHSQARAFRAMLKGLEDPPFLKASATSTPSCSATSNASACSFAWRTP